MIARRTFATVLGAAALAAASLLTAAPALAAGPEHRVETADFTIPAHPYYSEVCGFPIELHVWGSYSIVEWTDEAGNVTKEIRNFRFRSTSTANGVSVEGTTRGPEIWTFAEDGSSTLHRVGVVNRRIPGQGTVTIFSGYELKYINGDLELLLSEPAGQREPVELMCSAFTS